MTAPRTPREFKDEITDLRGTLDDLLKVYPEAYDYGHWPPSRGRGGGGHVSHEETDPTSAVFHARGRVRGLLRKINGRVNVMVRVAAEARDAFDDIFEQGPLLNGEPLMGIPSPAAGAIEEGER